MSFGARNIDRAPDVFTVKSMDWLEIMKSLTEKLNEIPPMMNDFTLPVNYARLVELEHKAKDLERAQKLIERLRAENSALKLERRDMRKALADRESRLKTIPHRYGFRLAALTIGLPLSER